MMNPKFKKYVYKSIYGEGNYYKKLNLYGGDGIDYNKFSELIDYVKKIETHPQNPPHMIILYGPPASGKSDARNVILRELGLKKTDIYELNLDKILADHTKFKEIAQCKPVTTEECFKIRACGPDKVFEFILALAYFKKFSFSVEITGGSKDFSWWNDVIELFAKHGFIISVVYPFVSNVKDLIARAQRRYEEPTDLSDKRCVSHQSLESGYPNSVNNFDKSIKTNKNIANVLQYNNDNKGTEKTIMFIKGFEKSEINTQSNDMAVRKYGIRQKRETITIP